MEFQLRYVASLPLHGRRLKLGRVAKFLSTRFLRQNKNEFTHNLAIFKREIVSDMATFLLKQDRFSEDQSSSTIQSVQVNISIPRVIERPFRECLCSNRATKANHWCGTCVYYVSHVTLSDCFRQLFFQSDIQGPFRNHPVEHKVDPLLLGSRANVLMAFK